MRHGTYTDSLTALRYPIGELSDLEKTRIASLDFKFEELTSDHIVFAISRALVGTIHAYFKISEEIVGRDMTLQIARRVGIKYGGANYEAFLKSRGVKKGTPALMAEFQDKVHSIRGPVHAAARWAEFDDEKCVVRRKRCVFYEWHLEGTEQYIHAFEAGTLEGYKQIDPAMIKAENPRCLSKGDDDCEHIWVFKP